jgi:hypothetical protein
MNISFTEHKGVVVIVKEVYYGQVYEFNDVEYGRFYEVAHAIDLWLEKKQ